MLNIVRKKKKNRGRYSEQFYDFSQILYSLCAKSYRVLRQVLPFPSKNRLHNKYSMLIKNIKKSLTDLDFCLDLISKYNITGECTLAIDAFAFRTFNGSSLGCSSNSKNFDQTMKQYLDEAIAEESSNETETEESSNDPATEESLNNKSPTIIVHRYSYGFIFLIVPLDYSFPPKIIHIKLSENGSYKEEIDQIAEFIKQKLRQIGIIPLFQATDGDRGASQIHEVFFVKQSIKI